MIPACDPWVKSQVIKGQMGPSEVFCFSIWHHFRTSTEKFLHSILGLINIRTHYFCTVHLRQHLQDFRFVC